MDATHARSNHRPRLLALVSLLTLLGLSVNPITGQPAATQPDDQKQPWAVKAFTPQGHTMDIKAVTQDGNLLDVKAIPNSGHLLDVKAIDPNGHKIPIKLLHRPNPDANYPVAAILPSGETAPLVALPVAEDNEPTHQIVGMNHQGSLVDIKGVDDDDGPPHAVKAISPQGTVFAVKGLVLDDGAAGGEVHTTPYAGAVKAIPDLHE